VALAAAADVQRRRKIHFFRKCLVGWRSVLLQVQGKLGKAKPLLLEAQLWVVGDAWACQL
jgi:hypothetical protein